MSMRLSTGMFFTSTLSEILIYSNIFFLIIYLHDSKAVLYFRTVSLHRKEESLYFLKKLLVLCIYHKCQYSCKRDPRCLKMCSQTPKQGNVNVENNGKKWLRSYKESLTQMNIVSRTSWL